MRVNCLDDENISARPSNVRCHAAQAHFGRLTLTLFGDAGGLGHLPSNSATLSLSSTWVPKDMFNKNICLICNQNFSIPKQELKNIILQEVRPFSIFLSLKFGFNATWTNFGASTALADAMADASTALANAPASSIGNSAGKRGLAASCHRQWQQGKG